MLEDLQPGGWGVEVADAVVVGAASVQTVACARLQDVPILAQIIIIIIITIIQHHHHHHHLVALVEEVGGARLAVTFLILDT